MFYVFLLLSKISVLTILILIITNGLKQNLNTMEKQNEEEVTYQEDAPAVPPKIPDAHLDKVSYTMYS